jgi:hypothetical protein
MLGQSASGAWCVVRGFDGTWPEELVRRHDLLAWGEWDGELGMGDMVSYISSCH